MQNLLSSLNKKGESVQRTINALTTEFEVCRKTITRLWKEVQKQRLNNNIVINLNNKRVGRQAPYKIQFVEKKFKSIKFELKCTLPQECKWVHP